ncbi:head-tail joining protein [Sphingomonas faeni]|uniref:head-tail joining protein n=1 Tax=Sphingomonas faeni TaxID=185950 RepID=UPI003EBF17C6
MDPFGLALDALFMAPGSAAAVFQPADGVPVNIRVIRSAPDRDTGFGQGRVIDNAGTILELRRSDVEFPQPGDFVVIGGEIVDGQVTGGDVFTLFGDPVLDLERIGWTCGATAT